MDWFRVAPGPPVAVLELRAPPPLKERWVGPRAGARLSCCSAIGQASLPRIATSAQLIGWPAVFAHSWAARLTHAAQVCGGRVAGDQRRGMR